MGLRGDIQEKRPRLRDHVSGYFQYYKWIESEESRHKLFRRGLVFRDRIIIILNCLSGNNVSCEKLHFIESTNLISHSDERR